MVYAFVASAVDLGRARGPRLAFVVHMAEGGGTVGYLSRANPNSVSVHFVIERNGRTVQMLDLDRMHSSLRANAVRTTDDADRFYGATAAKAVMGNWARPGKTLGPNHASIAVEIEGFARDGPNKAQQAALKALYADLRKRYPGIRSLGHRDFASYKACPGKRIPWDQIGGHGKSAQPTSPKGATNMADRKAVLEVAVAKNKQYLANTGGLGYAEKIKRYEAEIAAIDALAAAKAGLVAAEDWSGTFDQALARFLDALEAKQIAGGVDVMVRGQSSGHAYTRAENIELARSIGVLDELGGDDFFGALVPGANQ